jgi:hypothetical protein
MSKRALLGAVLLVACGEEDTPTREERSLHELCVELSVSECKQHTECRVSSGRRVFAALQCIDEGTVELGCRAASGVCGDASPVARDAQGQPWLFDDTCVPPSFTLATREELRAVEWSTCSQGGAPLDTDASVSLQDASAWGDSSFPPCEGSCDFARCSELDVASCKGDARCRVLKAWPFDRDRKCRGDELELGCTHAEACDPTPAQAWDALGRSYIVAESGAGCVPAGYSTDRVDGLYELCNAPQVDRCAGLTFQDCAQHPECREGLGCPVPPTSSGPGECEQRTIDSCKVDTKCASMAGRAVDAACNAQELVGCLTLTRRCHVQTTYAYNPAGRLFELPSDCLPPGFTEVGFADIPLPGAGTCPVRYEQRCSALGVEDCTRDPGCELLVGEPLDLDAQCIRTQSVAFGCVAKSNELHAGPAVAAEPQGARYRVYGYRYSPDHHFYTASDKYYSAATAALLAWPGCP